MIGRTVGLISSVGKTPVLQAGSHRFESCNRHTFSSLVYFTILGRRSQSVVVGGVEFADHE